ncbi:efflux RND transporter permease subunit, partial [Mycobacterium tuberculosis]|nr:efflux RND transporter permease subunit [Mycobacterium tuberculosis]
RGLDWINDVYRKVLYRAMQARWLVVCAGIIVALSAGVLFVQLPSELAPIEDRGVVRIAGTAPEGSTLAFTERYGAMAETIMEDIPEIETYFSVYGFPQVTGFGSFGLLKDWSERD